MRIFFITNSLTGGGAERAISNLINSLDTDRFEISLIPINAGEKDKIVAKCHVHPLNRPHNGSIKSIIVSAVKLQIQIFRLRPKYLILNCALPELIGALTFGKHKLITVEHSRIPWSGRENLGRVTRRILKLRKSRWVVVSSDLQIWSLEKVETITIPNAMELDGVKTLQEEYIVGETSKKRLVFIGRLSHEKQPLQFLEIARLTELSSIVIGDGPLRAEMERFVVHEQLDCIFLGYVPDPWILTDGSNDILLVTSRTEGDGLVIAEAILRNFPLLVSDIPDLHRFKFPPNFYCKGIGGFCTAIANYQSGELQLNFEVSFVRDFMESRNPRFIVELWETILQ